MPCLDMTVTVQRLGVLDLFSMTARTIPVIGKSIQHQSGLLAPELGIAATSSL